MKFERVKGEQNRHLFRRDGKKVYWVRLMRNNRRIEFSTKTENLTEARLIRDVEVARLLGKKPKLFNRFFLVEQKFPEYLDLKKGTVSKPTHDSMTNSWENHLKEHIGGLLLDEVTETWWLKYVAIKRETDPKRKFFNERKYLSMFLGWCHRDGLIQQKPRLEDVDPEIDAGKVFTDDEVRRLIRAAEPPTRLMILMAVTSGMRHGEIWSLEWSQINWIKRTITLPAEKTKIRQSRTFVMSEHAFLELKSHQERNEFKSRWVFPNWKSPEEPAGRAGTQPGWYRALDKANVQGRFHDLRHTFLTKAFKKAINPALICDYAGLSLEEASRTYLHFTHEDTAVVASLVALGEGV